MCDPSSKNGNQTKNQKEIGGQRITSSFRWFLGMLCASIFTMSYILVPPYILSAIVMLLFGYPNTNAAFFYSLPLIISIFTPPRSMPHVVGLLSPMLDYFEFDQIIEAEDSLRKNTDEGKNYIFACQPHGVLSLCGMCSSVKSEVKYRKINTAVASSLLSFPILKNVMGIFKLVDASSSNLRKILKRPGIEGSVVIYVGGIAELFKSSREEERLHLSQRKGFIKLALREGVDIIPVYLFGNTSILSVIRNKHLAKYSRKLQVSFTYFWGKFLLPIPRNDKLFYVAGAPLSIPKISEPTQEDIDKYHKLYCQEITRIFESYKHMVPLYKDKKLIID